MEVVPIGPHGQEADAPPVQDDGVGAAPREGLGRGGGAGVEGVVEHLLGLLWWEECVGKGHERLERRDGRRLFDVLCNQSKSNWQTNTVRQTKAFCIFGQPWST